MSSIAKRGSIVALADRLHQDIRCRGLREGDRYLSTVEAAKMLGVSTATAHRALTVLSDSESLIRRPKAGTFIGPKAGVEPATAIRTVYVLIDDTYADQTYRFDLIARGVRNEMGSVNILLSYLPAQGSVQYVTELLQAAQSSGEVAGVVPMSCGRDVYRLLSYAGLPTVVMGSLYLSDPALTSIDMDNHEAGALLVDYLYKRGHRKLVMLPPPELRPGDNARFAGITNALTALRMPANSLVVHSCPHDPSALTAITENLLSTPDRPTGFILWSKGAADTVAAAIDRMGMRIPDDVELVYFDHAMEMEQQPEFTCVRPQLGFEAIGSLAARLLKQYSLQETPSNEAVVMPVQLVEAR